MVLKWTETSALLQGDTTGQISHFPHLLIGSSRYATSSEMALCWGEGVWQLFQPFNPRSSTQEPRPGAPRGPSWDCGPGFGDIPSPRGGSFFRISGPRDLWDPPLDCRLKTPTLKPNPKMKTLITKANTALKPKSKNNQRGLGFHILTFASYLKSDGRWAQMWVIYRIYTPAFTLYLFRSIVLLEESLCKCVIGDHKLGQQ